MDQQKKKWSSSTAIYMPDKVVFVINIRYMYWLSAVMQPRAKCIFNKNVRKCDWIGFEIIKIFLDWSCFAEQCDCATSVV